jgi:hypothetical protein
VSFAAITICDVSQPEFIVVRVYFVMTQSGNFWIHPRIIKIIYIHTHTHTHNLCMKQLFCVKNYEHGDGVTL